MNVLLGCVTRSSTTSVLCGSNGLCAICQHVDLELVTYTKNDKILGCLGEFPVQRLAQYGSIPRDSGCGLCRLIHATATAYPRKKWLRSTDFISIRRRPVYGKDFTFWCPDHQPPADVLGEGHRMESVFEVIASEDDWEESRIIGRIVSDDPKDGDLEITVPHIRWSRLKPYVDLDVIRGWIHTCDKNHFKCRRGEREGLSERTVRFIDLQEDTIVTGSMAEDYVALSYVWGGAAPILTKERLPSLSRPGGLDRSVLPQTISATMELTASLGFRYLWVDSLCIVQNDEKDKLHYLPVMDHVYRCASFAIIAIAGDDAHRGLPGLSGLDRDVLQYSETISGKRFVTTQPPLRDLLECSTWQTRGWTFQEGILSQRRLFITESQLYWDCQTAHFREDEDVDHMYDERDSDHPIFLDSRGTELASLIQSDDCLSHPWRGGVKCRTKKYCDLAKAYSERQFSNEKDVLWAYQGILKILSTDFPRGFVWGVPYEILDAVLLWHPQCHCIHDRQAQHGVLTDDRTHYLSFPSWSWMSVNVGVRFVDECGDDTISEVVWYSAISEEESLPDAVATVQEQSDAASGGQQLKMPLEKLHLTAQIATLRMVENSRPNASQKMMGTPSSWLTRITSWILACMNACRGILKRTFTDPSKGITRDAESQKLSEDDEDVPDPNYLAKTSIHLKCGKQIAEMLVPPDFLNRDQERSGEFVLLSSNLEKLHGGDEDLQDAPLHRDQLKTERAKKSHNVMLIEWIEGTAYRRGLTTIEESDWKSVETVTKQIVLG